MLKRAPLTRAILIVIGLVYVGEIFAARQMLDGGAIIPGLLKSGQYWRLLTSMFLHAPPQTPYGLGWLHVLANSWAIFQLGMLYEVLFGSKRFALVYFVSGICAGIASSAYTNAEAVGASGAVFGLLGAFIFSIWRSPQYRHQRWTKSLLGQIVFWTVLNLNIGSQFPFVDNVAHIGGLVAGLLLGFLPHRVPPPSPASTVIDVQPYDEM